MMSSGLNIHDRKPPTTTGQDPPCSSSLFTILQGTQQEKHLHFIEVGTDQAVAQRSPACQAGISVDLLLPTWVSWKQG